MMKGLNMRHIIAFLLVILPVGVFAGTPYYSFPDIVNIPDTSRVLIRDTVNNIDYNITWSKLKSEMIKSIGDPSDAPLKKQPVATSPYIRQMEVRDSTGKITYYVTAGGVVIIGTPVPIAINAVYPANGVTGVNAATTIPSVTFNKEVTATLSSLYILDNTTAPAEGPRVYTIPATLAAGTTYKIRVNLPFIGQDADDMSMSCGVLTDLGEGVCESTFTTAP